MKKLMMMAVVAGMATAATAPALANQHDKDWDAKVEKMVDHHMAEVDTNKDGSVTKAEMDAFGTKKFDEADANDDGALSRAEIIAAKKAEKAKMKDMKD
jgi:hypothetical protein